VVTRDYREWRCGAIGKFKWTEGITNGKILRGTRKKTNIVNTVKKG
jgi:hypothetical protein